MLKLIGTVIAGLGIGIAIEKSSYDLKFAVAGVIIATFGLFLRTL